MDHFEKFLGRLNKKLREKLQTVASAIITNQLESLDIKPLQGEKDTFRCRMGKIRILFKKMGPDRNVIIDADFRGNIYK